MAKAFENYKGLQRLEPAPSGVAGLAVNNNFTAIGDYMETTTAAVNGKLSATSPILGGDLNTAGHSIIDSSTGSVRFEGGIDLLSGGVYLRDAGHVTIEDNFFTTVILGNSELILHDASGIPVHHIDANGTGQLGLFGIAPVMQQDITESAAGDTVQAVIEIQNILINYGLASDSRA